jgi:hypothetical protein
MPLHRGILIDGILVAHVVESIAEARNHALVRALKIDRPVAVAPNLEAALVQ